MDPMNNPRDPHPHVDPESPAYKIMMLWGSNLAFARALKRAHSTTQRWVHGGHIPPDYHAEVYAAAQRDGKVLTPADFLDARAFVAAP